MLLIAIAAVVALVWSLSITEEAMYQVYPVTDGPAPRAEALYAQVVLGVTDTPFRDLVAARSLVPSDARFLLLQGDLQRGVFWVPDGRGNGTGEPGDVYRLAARQDPNHVVAHLRVVELLPRGDRDTALSRAAACAPDSLVVQVLTTADDRTEATKGNSRQMLARASQIAERLAELPTGTWGRPLVPEPQWDLVEVRQPKPFGTGAEVEVVTARAGAHSNEWVNPTPRQMWRWGYQDYEPFADEVGTVVEVGLDAAATLAGGGDTNAALDALEAVNRLCRQYASARPYSYRHFEKGRRMAATSSRRGSRMLDQAGLHQEAARVAAWGDRLAAPSAAESDPLWRAQHTEDTLIPMALAELELEWPSGD
jgi:hypothetical protein